MCLCSPGSLEHMTICGRKIRRKKDVEERQGGGRKGRQADCVSGRRGSDASEEMEPSSAIGTRLVSKFTPLTLIPIFPGPDVSACC